MKKSILGFVAIGALVASPAMAADLREGASALIWNNALFYGTGG